MNAKQIAILKHARDSSKFDNWDPLYRKWIHNNRTLQALVARGLLQKVMLAGRDYKYVLTDSGRAALETAEGAAA